MIDEERREAAIRQFTEWLERLAERKCVVCATPVSKYEKEGRCTYAEPCGHKQYQGDPPND